MKQHLIYQLICTKFFYKRLFIYESLFIKCKYLYGRILILFISLCCKDTHFY